MATSLTSKTTTAPDSGQLSLSGNSMEWSVHNTGTGSGYLYFGNNIWEFAPELSVDATTFYPKNDPGGGSAFGSNWGSNSILISVGSSIVARRTADASTIFFMKIQSYDSTPPTITVDYLEFTVE